MSASSLGDGGPLQPAHQPFHPLNYKLLAESIKNRRKHEEANLKMLKQGTAGYLDNFW